MKKTLSFILALLLLCGMIPLAATEVSALDVPDDSRCKSSLVYCIEATQLLYEKNIDEVVYPTGLTKLMTAILASEYATKCEDGFDTMLTVTASAYHSTEGTDIELRINEQMSIYNLMVGMLLAGANDCANVLAEKIGGSIDGFVELMNEKAAEIGMTSTWFTNPTGMHDDNMITTARDMLTLAMYATADSHITEIASEMTVVIPETNKSEARSIGTRNYLVSPRTVERYYLDISSGLMCGSTTEGGYCIIGTASDNGNNYICVVMDADYDIIVDQEEVLAVDEEGNYLVDEETGEYVVLVERESHVDYYSFIISYNLLVWANKSFGFIKAVDRSTAVCEVKVRLAKNTDRVTLIPESPIEIFVPTDLDRDKDIVLDYTLDDEVLYAPIAAGTQVGKVSVTYKGDYIGTVPLIVSTTIEQDSFLVILNTVAEICKTPIMKAVIGLIIVCSIAFVAVTVTDLAKRDAEKKRLMIPRGHKYLNSKPLKSKEPKFVRSDSPFVFQPPEEKPKKSIRIKTAKPKTEKKAEKKPKGLGKPVFVRKPKK